MKYSMQRLIVALVVLVFAFANQSQAVNVNKIIKKVQKTYDDMDNLTATFTKNETFKLTGSVTELAGTFYVKKGVKYRFETEDQIVVTDGKSVWTYNAISGQLLIDDVRENTGAFLPRDMLFKYPKDHYATLLGEDKTGKKTVYTVRLDPKEDSTGFLSAIKLWIEDKTWHILKIETIDLGGNSSTFIIESMDTDKKLDEALFQYTAPEGVDVIDMRKSAENE
jgi:chaperone LolA